MIRYSHGFCVVIKVSRVHCAFRTLELSKDEKYLTSKVRLWILKRDFVRPEKFQFLEKGQKS